MEDIFKQCKNIILEHESRNKSNAAHTTQNPIIQIKIIHHCESVGISCYTICLIAFGMYERHPHIDYGQFNDYIHNIPYIPDPVLDMIPTIQLNDDDVGVLRQTETGFKYIDYFNPTVYLAKFKKQIVDKLNEDPIFQKLSKLNIIDEIQELKTENKKFQKEREYQCSELSSMRRSIHRMQEDMKQLLATTSKIQEENTQLTKLLHEEKEKTKQLSTTIQESQCLSFTQANTIGQALMGNSDIFNCM